jgi:hypothetical protein
VAQGARLMTVQLVILLVASGSVLTIVSLFSRSQIHFCSSFLLPAVRTIYRRKLPRASKRQWS